MSPEQLQSFLSLALAWAARIQDALDRGRFVLHAQPIIDLGLLRRRVILTTVLVGTVLAGPMSRAIAVRRRMAPVLDDRAGIAWAALAAAYLLLILWGPTHALRTLWGIVLLGLLLAAGVIALRRQTLREFTPAGRQALPQPADGEPAGAPQRPPAGG